MLVQKRPWLALAGTPSETPVESGVKLGLKNGCPSTGIEKTITEGFPEKHSPRGICILQLI